MAAGMRLISLLAWPIDGRLSESSSFGRRQMDLIHNGSPGVYIYISKLKLEM